MVSENINNMTTYEFKYVLLDLTRRINDGMNIMINQLGSKYNLSPLQFRVLMEAHKEESISIGALANSALIAKANMTSICKKLEDMGYLNRYRDPEDDRKVLVILTKLGNQVVGEIDIYYTEKIQLYFQEGKKGADIIDGIEKVLDLLEFMNNR